jgi:phage-related protein
MMMEKPIEIVLLKQAEDFLDEIEEPVRRKFFVSMRKTETRIFGDWFKKLIGTNDIYEFRIDFKGEFYRLFSFWDSRDGKQTLVVCTHGLVKKSNKTPKSEIEKAEYIKNKYFKGLI